MSVEVPTTVGSIATKKLVFVDYQASLTKVAELMVKENVDFVLVKEDGSISGLITKRGLIKALMKELVSKKAGEVTSDFVAFDEKESLLKVVNEMTRKNTNLSIITSNNQPIGFISLKDLMKVVLALIVEYLGSGTD